ncbi:MAG TPA: DUF190 domain-containing protein [Terriglobales bacterium]|nr:DUF190 domain-containing protein [Terriglobales bacterium]
MKAKRVSIYINEADQWHGRPLHLELMQALAKEGMAGATVLRGVAGYTRAAGISTTSLVDAGGLLPLVIEFIESEENIERMMPTITKMVGNRLVTVTEVDIRHGGAFPNRR